MIKYIHANAFSILFKLIAITFFEHLQQISSISMSFEEYTDRISIYIVLSRLTLPSRLTLQVD